MNLILPSDGASMDPWTSRYQASAWGVSFDVPGISHIIGNIYVGGCYPGMVLPDKFTHVVSLHDPGFTVPEGHPASVTRFAIDDDVATPVDRPAVLALAREALQKAAEGPVLFHCQMGINRSAMVAAATMVLSGYSPEEAIYLIRKARPGTLSNRAFQKFLISFRPSKSE